MHSSYRSIRAFHLLAGTDRADRILRMLILTVAFAVSLVMTLIAVRSAKTHAHLSHDHDLSGPQKFHVLPVPRIGGLGILAGALAGAGCCGLTTLRPARRLCCCWPVACLPSWPAWPRT
jgi:UDP-N-acetylmuramyl pentapeptide phosphotransferase/UDP-N-acetylglucosamine-1-phosphate transferase